MAHQTHLLISLAIFLMSLTAALGSIECEDLPIQACAFTVSSSGARCVLETMIRRDGSIQHECQTSAVLAENLVEWIETDECISACGLDRMSVGLSTDTLVESSFTRMLCSAECQNNCPNVLDLYSKLAAGEGVYLPHLCEAQTSSSRRLVTEVSFASVSKNTINAGRAPAPVSRVFENDGVDLAPEPSAQP